MIKQFLIGALLGAMINSVYAIDTHDLGVEGTQTSQVSGKAVGPEVQTISQDNIVVRILHSGFIKKAARLAVLGLAVFVTLGALIQDKPTLREGIFKRDEIYGYAKIGIGCIAGVKTLQYLFPQGKAQTRNGYFYRFISSVDVPVACSVLLGFIYHEQGNHFLKLWGVNQL
jgi:hypothetical protein